MQGESTSNMRRLLKGKHPTVLLPDKQEAAAASKTTSETAATSAAASTDAGVSTNTTRTAAVPRRSMEIFARKLTQPAQQNKLQ